MSSYSLFIDFDFTITTDDVGNRFYTYFSGGRNEHLVRLWKRREISSYVCLREEAKLCRGSREEFARYIDKFEIDSGFGDILGLTKKHEIPLFIVSDGLDFYIHRLLGKFGFENIKIYSNHAEFVNGGLEITFPHWSEKCVELGSCKGEIIRKNSRAGDKVIFIGDGISDVQAVDEADIIFAKDDLAEYMREYDLKYIEYDNLKMAAEKLAGILETVDIRN